MTPLRIFRTFAVIEAITWALLILGMLLKYAFDATEVGVSIAGPIHGFAFLAFVVVTLLVWMNNHWSVGRGLLGLVSAVIPFATVPFEMVVARKGGLDGDWRREAGPEASVTDRFLTTLTGRPLMSFAVVAVVVVVVFAILMVVGGPFAD
ncbi:MAG: DUF3817 domain-containing protein [Mycobacteriaceae bacterium]|uniref:DUF3817 domain-containing protein n=1 Tax=Corynebacterium sp. TaxID=1720 RepID=UPI003F9B7272